MRASSRSALVVARHRPSSRLLPFVCTHCQPSTSSPPNYSSSRAASSNNKPSKDNLPFSERVRRRIWGTDNPPGQKDPYGPATPEDRRRQREEEALLRQSAAEENAKNHGRRPQKGSALTEDAPDTTNEVRNTPVSSGADNSDIAQRRSEVQEAGGLSDLGYTPAQTWDGLPRIGGKHTKKMIADKVLEERPFNPFLNASEPNSSSPDQIVHTELLQLLARQTGSGSSNSAESSTTVAALDIENWEQYDISDPKFKFALVHRITHASGRRLPDPAIASFRTAGDIVRFLTKPSTPPTIAEQLLGMPELQALPNVEIYARRHDRVARDVEFGRAKVIREELARRGLLDDDQGEDHTLKNDAPEYTEKLASNQA